MNIYLFHIKEKYYTDAKPEGYFFEEYNKVVYAENLVDAVAEVTGDGDSVVTFVASEPAPDRTSYSLPPAMVSVVPAPEEEDQE